MGLEENRQTLLKVNFLNSGVKVCVYGVNAGYRGGEFKQLTSPCEMQRSSI